MSNMKSEHEPKKKQSTRQRILEVAARLFAEDGYTTTTVRDIAAELGIANPSLYYHFKSKSEIMTELLAEPLRLIEEAIQEAESLEGTARIRRIIRGLLESLEIHSGIVITTLPAAEPESEFQQQLVADNQMRVVGLLARDAAEDNRDLRVTMAIAGVQGVVMGLMRSSESADSFVEQLRDRREIITELVLRILGEPSLS